MNTDTPIDNADIVGHMPSSRALMALIDSYEPTGDQLSEQRQLGYDDGYAGRKSRYAGAVSHAELAYQQGWRAGATQGQSDEVNGMCETDR